MYSDRLSFKSGFDRIDLRLRFRIKLEWYCLRGHPSLPLKLLRHRYLSKRRNWQSGAKYHLYSANLCEIGDGG